MAYDQRLAERIRNLIGLDPEMTEKAMFGGLAFLVNGHMAIAASGHGGILVRVDPADSMSLVNTTPAELMEMRGRKMAGWLRVDADEIQDDTELEKWVHLGIEYVRTLPPKE